MIFRYTLYLFLLHTNKTFCSILTFAVCMCVSLSVCVRESAGSGWSVDYRLRTTHFVLVCGRVSLVCEC